MRLYTAGSAPESLSILVSPLEKSLENLKLCLRDFYCTAINKDLGITLPSTGRQWSVQAGFAT